MQLGNKNFKDAVASGVRKPKPAKSGEGKYFAALMRRLTQRKGGAGATEGMRSFDPQVRDYMTRSRAGMGPHLGMGKKSELGRQEADYAAGGRIPEFLRRAAKKGQTSMAR